MALLAAELPCMTRPVLLPVLYVGTVVYLQRISQLQLQKTPLIYFRFPVNHLDHLYMSNFCVLSNMEVQSQLQSVTEKNSNGRSLDVPLGTVICIELDKPRNTGNEISSHDVAGKASTHGPDLLLMLSTLKIKLCESV